MVKKFYFVFLVIFFWFCNHALSQSCFNISVGRDTTLPCSQSCLTLQANVPDIRSTTNYKVIPYNYDPFPYYIAGGTTVPIPGDDRWSSVINIPFTFCFFGTNYTQLVIGANGLISFDLSYANGSLGYVVTNSLPSTTYARSCVMGVFHDIDPSDPGGNSPSRSVQYSVVGSAPCRKLILNFFKIPLYGSASSNAPSYACRRLLATHQIVLFEGTGVIDVNIQDKPFCSDWNNGGAIVGIQNYGRTIGVAPPGRNGGQWGNSGMNESWRFVPNDGTSLLDSVKLYNGSVYLGTGSTTSLGTGELQATFNNVCTTSDTTSFRIVASYKRCDNPANLITAEDTIRVIHPGTIPVTTSLAPASCSSAGIGIVTVTNPLGTAYQYSIDSGRTFQTSPIFNIPGGTYTVRARNTQTGCVSSTSVTVPIIETVRFSAGVFNATCYGVPNGQILVSTQSGAQPFQFSADSGATYQGSNLLLVGAGRYVVRVKDNNGCFKDTIVIITQPDSIHITEQVAAAYCSGNADGKITVSASGGTPGYRYSLTNATAGYQADSVLNANVGTFTVYIKDAKNCLDSSTSITVPLSDTMRLLPLPDTAVCVGSSIVLVANTNATQFAWGPNNFVNDTALPRPTFSPQDTATYYLTAKLGMLCSRTDTFNINVLKRPIPNAGNDTTICYGTYAYLNATAIRSNTFRWRPAAYLSNANLPNPRATGYVPIRYTVEVTDPYGCGFKEYDTVQLTVRPPVRAYAGQDTTATLGQPVQLFGCCMDIYRWEPSGIFENDTARNPVGHFPPGNTQVVMTTTTPEGCEGRDTVLVKGYTGPTYYVPSGFTPNGDGRNDVLRPIPVGIVETYYFNVYNRFGQLLYTTKTFMEGWDGRWKGEPQPQAAYVWMVKGKGIDGKIVEQKGTVVLMR